jgi:hypothetical protein
MENIYKIIEKINNYQKQTGDVLVNIARNVEDFEKHSRYTISELNKELNDIRKHEEVIRDRLKALNPEGVMPQIFETDRLYIEVDASDHHDYVTIKYKKPDGTKTQWSSTSIPRAVYK